MPLDLELNLGAAYSEDLGNSKVWVDYGDFKIPKGKFKVIPKDDTGLQVGQRLHVRLLLRRGEVFFDTLAGFPYVQLSKFKRTSEVFDTYMKSYIVDTAGVSNLQRYSSVLDKYERNLHISFDVTTQSGDLVSYTQELPV
ncbi:baseplate wedge subunit [Yersinia phage vB_YenM_P778]